MLNFLFCFCFHFWPTSFEVAILVKARGNAKFLRFCGSSDVLFSFYYVNFLKVKKFSSLFVISFG